ncbi:ImmA/IrrE family metallo-endopeptidase [Arthrobacter cryoconiti]|uniref:ImmA/IrrE family metallo-endopeptidase n=1 Tax=Arthrobacter cryoconiti TaxID=748907 RepID=A0ABV8R540_9MICC|nr:ImmA/IrrE family metallo-endopeptidase [Arthrobacter cryoconiti]MCC9069967.1 ImmA/IrrE family metallo-endopeptidase [Arthrobacter cryoconiti]
MTMSSAEEEGKLAASKFRADHGLGVWPLNDLVALIETRLDIDVAILDVEAKGGEHGLTMFDPKGGATFIGVAKTDHPMRQRSTLAHELSHALFRDWVDFDQPMPLARERREQRADAFARHLLVPEDSLRWFLAACTPGDLQMSHLSAVVQTFLVSPAIAAIAMDSAGFINSTTKAQWMGLHTPGLATQFGWLDQYRTLQADSSQTRAPQRLLTRAIRGYVEDIVTVETVASIRGLSASAVKEELDAAGIAPKVVEAVIMSDKDFPAVEVDQAFLDALDDLDRQVNSEIEEQ